jgi:hypothetical protein
MNKMKNKYPTITFVLEGIMLIIWIITLIIFLTQVYSKGTICLTNPLVYGTKVLSEKNDANMTCLCQFDNALDYTIFVDKNHWVLNYTGTYVTYRDPTNWNLKINFTEK